MNCKNCKNCNSELLPTDDVNSARYKQLGCLRCQVSIAAGHEYGDPVEPTMGITKDEAVLILNRLSDLGAALLTQELLLAKRLIQHFHVCDFGYLLTELDDRQRRPNAPPSPLTGCAHTRTKPYNIGFDDGICCADCGRMM